jgi:hypothetical protein
VLGYKLKLKVLFSHTSETKLRYTIKLWIDVYIYIKVYTLTTLPLNPQKQNLFLLIFQTKTKCNKEEIGSKNHNSHTSYANFFWVLPHILLLPPDTSNDATCSADRAHEKRCTQKLPFCSLSISHGALNEI